MKRIIKLTLSIALLIVIILSSLACKSTMSTKTHSLNNVSYTYKRTYLNIEQKERLKTSAYKIYSLLSEDIHDNGENYVISPLSIYMAFALLDYVGDEELKKEVGDLLGLSEEDILNAGEVFNAVFTDRDNCKALLTNSIWTNSDREYEYKQEVLDSLAQLFYCYAYEAPFTSDNKTANNDIRKFVKENTKNLIDQNFNLDTDTSFALINTLYLKDNWLEKGDELKTENRTFHKKNSDVQTQFLIGNYNSGVVVENDVMKTMYTRTYNGYQLRFIVPQDGYTLKDAMSYESLINMTELFKESNYSIDASTRVIFPMFQAKTQVDVKEVLERKHMMSHSFDNFISNLVDDVDLFVAKIIHESNFKVEKKGIEGAAVTVVAVYDKASFDFGKEFYDFIVDKPFGFIVSTQDGIILFMGEINNPD